jgi:eukaryotic-like serine/threonine-protein kinase
LVTEGENIDKYILLEKIGEGGFSTVFHARDTILQRDAAIKILKTEFISLATTKSMFSDEARKAAALNHPNIIQIFDLLEYDQISAIAMEYLPAGNLSDWVKKHPNPSRKFVFCVLQQLADALDYIHDQGIIHRDVKPSNILLAYISISNETVSIRLSDFGLGEKADSLSDGGHRNILGSAPYVSPEQARNQKIDKYSDQYSLGLITYELIVGYSPFNIPGSDITAILAKRLIEKIPLPSEKNSNLPTEIDRVLLKALSISPNDRYPSCSNFISELTRIFQNNDRIRALELQNEANELISGNKFDIAQQKLEEAQLLSDTPDLQINQEYLKGVREWKTAYDIGKKLIHNNQGNYDPNNIFPQLGLLPIQRKIPNIKTIKEKLSVEQIIVGICLSIAYAVFIGYLSYLWLIKG